VLEWRDIAVHELWLLRSPQHPLSLTFRRASDSSP